MVAKYTNVDNPISPKTRAILSFCAFVLRGFSSHYILYYGANLVNGVIKALFKGLTGDEIA